MHLNLPFSARNTTVLVLSSVTCQLGVFAAEQRRRASRLRIVVRDHVRHGRRSSSPARCTSTPSWSRGGITISSHPYGSVFYLTTGFHGLHVTGGLIAFLLVLGRTFARQRFTHDQATSAIVVSYYWHFVDVVWIALFAHDLPDQVRDDG